MPIDDEIRQLATNYAELLKTQIANRMSEMQTDNLSHHLIYRVLGVSDEEGRLIDLYQNKGRFLYRYAKNL